MGCRTSTTIGAHTVSTRSETRENSSMYGAHCGSSMHTSEKRPPREGASGIVRMRKGVSHGNMQCVHARLLAPFCDLDRISERVPVPRGKDAKRAVQVAPGEFYDERKLASDRILNRLDYL